MAMTTTSLDIVAVLWFIPCLCVLMLGTKPVNAQDAWHQRVLGAVRYPQAAIGGDSVEERELSDDFFDTLKTCQGDVSSITSQSKSI